MTSICFIDKVEFEDTKGVIRICKSKENRQHNGQKKKYKGTNNDLQNTYKTKDIDFSFNSFYALPLEQGYFRIFYQHKM